MTLEEKIIMDFDYEIICLSMKIANRSKNKYSNDSFKWIGYFYKMIKSTNDLLRSITDVDNEDSLIRKTEYMMLRAECLHNDFNDNQEFYLFMAKAIKSRPIDLKEGEKNYNLFITRYPKYK